ncbi:MULTISPECIES: twin-arginine translocase TatA/TatE family subunit [unclassified Curtobacterium]|uniref:twin-arginine translocase TatA/TatE family subunit n=1 Tax=unclassified Curtobacterium TaxID=257496 RepID=UPI0021C4FA97|nr:twin-arginine translocase TatA/TatE family subunit [Curtobacterium sp. C2H10]MCT9620324.1 twin-arginine translocase TatA/TatE family subunit [Curtobacterium sp. C2H10]
MLGNLTGIHLLVILGIVILLFGATKLPALAKGLGQSLTIFRREVRDTEPHGTPTSDSAPAATGDSAPAATSTPTTPVE